MTPHISLSSASSDISGSTPSEVRSAGWEGRTIFWACFSAQSLARARCFCLLETHGLIYSSVNVQGFLDKFHLEPGLLVLQAIQEPPQEVLLPSQGGQLGLGFNV